jgi:hypothetical protein
MLALVATGFLSFGLWVHHMCATGLSPVAMSFFTAATMSTRRARIPPGTGARTPARFRALRRCAFTGVALCDRVSGFRRIPWYGVVT